MRKVTKIKYFSSKVFKCNLTCQRCSWRKSERSSAKQRPSSSLAPQTAPKLCCWTWQFQEKMERKASPQGKLVAETWGRLSCKSLWYFRHQRMKQKKSQRQQQQHRSSREKQRSNVNAFTKSVRNWETCNKFAKCSGTFIFACNFYDLLITTGQMDNIIPENNNWQYDNHNNSECCCDCCERFSRVTSWPRFTSSSYLRRAMHTS